MDKEVVDWFIMLEYDDGSMKPLRNISHSLEGAIDEELEDKGMFIDE